MRKRNKREVLESRGIKVRNKFELKALKDLQGFCPKGRKKPVVTYEEDRIDYTISASYNPDFKITFFDGRVIYIETKGKFDYHDQRKMKSVKLTNPDLDIRIVFERDAPIRKGARMRYSDWAKKNGFPFAIGSVPKEWLYE